MSSNPFTAEAPAQAAAQNQDFILVVILLGLMLFFLVRSLAKFKGSGIKISRPKGSDAKGSETEATAGEEEEEEEEEPLEEEEEEPGNESKED